MRVDGDQMCATILNQEMDLHQRVKQSIYLMKYLLFVCELTCFMANGDRGGDNVSEAYCIVTHAIPLCPLYLCDRSPFDPWLVREMVFSYVLSGRVALAISGISRFD